MAVGLRTDAEKIREQQRQERLMLITERKLNRRLAAELKRVAKEAESIFDAAGAAELDQIMPGHAARVDGILRREIGPLINTFVMRLQKAAEGKSWNMLERKDAASAVERFTEDYLNNHVIASTAQITGTTLKQMNDTIKRAVRDGIPERETGRLLQQHMSELSTARARMIARTETHTASQMAQTQMANEILPQQAVKEWVTAGDERVRDVETGTMHRMTNGQTVPKDQPFHVPMPWGGH